MFFGCSKEPFHLDGSFEYPHYTCMRVWIGGGGGGGSGINYSDIKNLAHYSSH